MSNKKVTELDLNTSPSLADLAYVVQLGPGPSWADKKVTLKTLQDFSRLSKTMVKGGSYTVQAVECDKRWFSNGYATEEITFVLPTAVEGMEVGFLVEKPYTVNIQAADGDEILPFSMTSGIRILSNTVGACIYLRFISLCWQVVSIFGIWNAFVSSSSSSSGSSSSISSISLSSSSCSACSSSSISSSCSLSSSSSSSSSQDPSLKFVAAGYKAAGNPLIYSYDGNTWFASANGSSVFPTAATAVCWNGSIYVAAGSGGSELFAYSSDGVTWTSSSNGSELMGTCTSICWNGSVFVASGSGTNVLIYSTDGDSWFASFNGNSMFSTCNCVCWNGSIFVAGGNSLSTHKLAYSVDGVNWGTTVNGDSIMNGGVESICWNGSIFVAGGGVSGGNTIGLSSDGLNWSVSNNGDSMFGGGASGCYTICWDGTKFVAGGNGVKVAVSYNGTDWSSTLGHLVFGGIVNSICWNGSLFVAGAGSSPNLTMGYSTDGISWTISYSGVGLLTNICMSVCSNPAPNLFPPV